MQENGLVEGGSAPQPAEANGNADEVNISGFASAFKKRTFFIV
jgi:hypothetical protein